MNLNAQRLVSKAKPLFGRSRHLGAARFLLFQNVSKVDINRPASNLIACAADG